jgi:hypothetical protein
VHQSSSPAEAQAGATWLLAQVLPRSDLVGLAKSLRAGVVTEARRLACKNGAGNHHSLRQVAAALAERGMLAPNGGPYLRG